MLAALFDLRSRSAAKTDLSPVFVRYTGLFPVILAYTIFQMSVLPGPAIHMGKHT